MPRTLRSRIALFVLLGAFLIPVATSSLRGLTHVLTCSEAEIPFSAVTVEGSDEPIITSARTLTRDGDQQTCEGLEFEFQGRQAGPGRVDFAMAVTNNSDFDWHGSVKLEIGGDVVPFDIGEIRRGSTARDSVRLRVPPGQLEVSGALLVGP
ncbi:MAG TPA: hypothetical protein VFO65_06445 [Acidimicrobiales bacterium]|nr:hypothetical protein [Acidimicrobiales bacterium]